ncbi:uncharacterized protein LOC111865724 [Cryptotermes secundus]|uniref:uncharacterized protein LOC111865724 n=1 Tax=Cryptotermes secundus TaxID=105785 RepID=UPI000CD7C3DA|nr:uncharacterized protein LOC111865724 [Cryptotermes secundus]XP_033607832.1 uncharacterized protein LOC111865724 [Cryptotermes secundus]
MLNFSTTEFPEHAETGPRSRSPVVAPTLPTPPSVSPPPLGAGGSSPIIVRAEEALIVLLVLVLWIAAIALFFNRWGKIRMLEPYQPKFQQQHRSSCPMVDMNGPIGLQGLIQQDSSTTLVCGLAWFTLTMLASLIEKISTDESNVCTYLGRMRINTWDRSSASHLFQIQRELHRRAGSFLAQTPPKLCLRRKLNDYGNPAYEPSTEDQVSNGYTDIGADRVWTRALWLHAAYNNGQDL